MSKGILIGLLVVLVVAAVGGYYWMSSKPAEPMAPAVVEQQLTPSVEYTVTLSEQNTSGVTGTAVLTEVGGKVKVVLSVFGGTEGVAQPAHIHVGACPNVGAVEYPLTSVMNGVSETMLDVSMSQLRAGLPLGLNVHKSTAEAGVYVACGDLY